MNFAAAVANSAVTENGMQAYKSTTSACMDLFYAVGASRGQNILPLFSTAFQENPALAPRIALWARDARGGAGERELFRQMLRYVATQNRDLAVRMLAKTPYLGRWDDVLHVPMLQNEAFTMVRKALEKGDGLCAKWMPRKGDTAVRLTKFLGMTPKQYRKTLVGLTQVVETQMCAKEWDAINFGAVPSLASARYRKAFERNTPKYAEYVAKLAKGEAKVNAGAVYPYQVLQGVKEASSLEHDLINAQWAALPNYVGEHKILPMVDVSGSMACPAGGNSSITCMHVAVSLGLYLADKVTGPFHGAFLTFSERPELQILQAKDIVGKYFELNCANWGINTDLERAMEQVLVTAVRGKVSAQDMPEYLLILSDMQFDMATRRSNTALDMIRLKYSEAGYEMPKVVFWNLNARGNVPATVDERGVALVSGFSPALMKAVLSASLEDFTPENVMLEAVMSERYDF